MLKMCFFSNFHITQTMNTNWLYSTVGLLIVYIMRVDLSVSWPAIVLIMLGIAQNNWAHLIYQEDELFDVDFSDEDDVEDVRNGHTVQYISQIISLVIAVVCLKLAKYIALIVMG